MKAKPQKNPTKVFNTGISKIAPDGSILAKIWDILTSKPRYGLSIILVGVILSLMVNLIFVFVVMAGIFIRIKQMERTGPDKYEIRRAKVNGGKIITTCHYCPYAEMKENIWSKNYPTYQCTEMGGKFNYIPGSIPRWCPHVLK